MLEMKRLASPDSKTSKNPREEEMEHIFDLPDEMLSAIMILMVMSCTGAADLVRLSATCKKFFNLSRQPLVLEDVNFNGVPFCSYEPHYNRNGLLCLCARVGNTHAEIMIAETLLNRDSFFWNMILEQDEMSHHIENPSQFRVLCHVRLVRTFIDYASDEHIFSLCIPLFRHLIALLGYKKFCASGLYVAVCNMAKHIRLEVHKILDNAQEDVGNDMPLNESDREKAELALDLGNAYRDRVIEIYDQVFEFHVRLQAITWWLI